MKGNIATFRLVFRSSALVAALSVCASAQTTGGSGQTQSGGTGQPTTTASQPTPWVQTPPTPGFVNLTRVSEDYRVGPGDQLEIQVIGHPDLNQTLRISNSGEISFPMLGQINVGDLTAFDVEELVAKQFRDKRLIERPEILVFVRDYQAKPIYVSGAVVSPGEFVMSQELTVADAVLLAGGLLFNAADEGFVHRRAVNAAATAGPSTEPGGADAKVTIPVDLKPLKEGRFFTRGMSLRGGDVVVIPRQTMKPYFVVGEVVDPRNYFFPPGRTLMASQAISFAKGPLPTAKLSKGMLVRYDQDGNRQELNVDYDAILNGRQKDFPIQPNDIIFIPGSRIKTIAHSLLIMTDTMVMQQSFRIGRRMQLPDREAVPE